MMNKRSTVRRLRAGTISAGTIRREPAYLRGLRASQRCCDETLCSSESIPARDHCHSHGAGVCACTLHAIAREDAAQEPPGRVGRLVLIDGTVSYHTADQNYWQRARRNYPVTTGQSFWTEPNSHAAIDIATNRIYLDGSTELDISALDDKFVIFYAGLINQFVDATSEQCSAPRTNLFPKLWRRLAHPAGRNRQRTFG